LRNFSEQLGEPKRCHRSIDEVVGEKTYEKGDIEKTKI